MPQRITIDTLATATPWEPVRFLEIQGTSAGSLLKDWAANLNRRWGHDAEARLREALDPATNSILPSAPTEADRLPGWLTCRTTDIVIATFLDGDRLALEECIWEDAQRKSNAAISATLRLIGPKMLLKHTHTIHSKLYDFGQAHAEVARRHATIEISGSPLYANPTWQMMQFFAIRMLLRAAHRELVELYGESVREDFFRLFVRWK